jgi:hypothetical protein
MVRFFLRLFGILHRVATLLELFLKQILFSQELFYFILVVLDVCGLLNSGAFVEVCPNVKTEKVKRLGQ